MINLVRIFNNLLNKRNSYKLINYPKHYPADEPIRRCPDISKSIKYLSFKPKIGLKTGIERMIKYNKLT